MEQVLAADTVHCCGSALELGAQRSPCSGVSWSRGVHTSM